jgi:acyl-CoA synthetase (NDP forming)
VLLADEAHDAGIEVPDFTATTKERLGEVIPAYTKAQNPLDLTGNVVSDPDIFGRTLAILEAAPDHDVYILFLGLMHNIADQLADALVAKVGHSETMIIVVWIGANSRSIARLEAAGIPVYPDIPAAVAALRGRFDLEAAQARLARLPHPANPPARATAGRFLSELSGQAIIETLPGLRFPRQAVVKSPAEVAGAIVGLRLPLVAKIQSPELPHKSEHGGVALSLGSEAEVANAVDRMLAIARDKCQTFDGILIQEMTDIAFELLVGVKNDPVFGPMLMLARGGVDCELSPDCALAFLPLSAEEIESQLLSLRSSPLFTGYRNLLSIDVGALASALHALCEMYLADDRLVEIEINPLALTSDAVACVIDNLITVTA